MATKCYICHHWVSWVGEKCSVLKKNIFFSRFIIGIGKAYFHGFFLVFRSWFFLRSTLLGRHADAVGSASSFIVNTTYIASIKVSIKEK